MEKVAVNIQMPVSVSAWIDKKAREENRSRSNMILTIILKAMKEGEK